MAGIQHGTRVVGRSPIALGKESNVGPKRPIDRIIRNFNLLDFAEAASDLVRQPDRLGR